MIKGKIGAFMGGSGAQTWTIAYRDDGKTPTLRASPKGGDTVPSIVYEADNVCEHDQISPQSNVCHEVNNG